jgi:hypothetical protein
MGLYHPAGPEDAGSSDHPTADSDMGGWDPLAIPSSPLILPSIEDPSRDLPASSNAAPSNASAASSSPLVDIKMESPPDDLPPPPRPPCVVHPVPRGARVYEVPELTDRPKTILCKLRSWGQYCSDLRDLGDITGYGLTCQTILDHPFPPTIASAVHNWIMGRLPGPFN